MDAASEGDFVVAFKVPKEGTHALGLRLAQLAGARGAVFDGWKDDKDSAGENHEMLEVGDRLIAVNDTLVAPGTSSFERIGRLVREAIESLLRRDEELEAKENETLRYGLAPVRSKYSASPNERANLRVRLKFRKPSHEQVVVLEEKLFAPEEGAVDAGQTATAAAELGAWFRPPDDTMTGAVFEGLLAEAAAGVRKAFQGVRGGLRLVAINNRSVEGLKFDIVLDCLREGRFPLLLRLGGAPALNDPEETRALARSLDAHFRLLQKPFGAAHLESFFSGLADADRDLVVNRIRDGLRLEVRDSGGRTPLMCAAMLGNEDDALFFADLFLHEGADVSETDNRNGASALHCAARIGHVSVITRLLQEGADPNFPDRQGRTPVLEAVICNNAGAVEVLLHAGGDGALIERSAGWNCLHYAALNGREDIVKLLLGKGKLSPHTRTLPGPWRAPRTAIEIAREAKHAEAACILHERMASEPLQRVHPRPGDWVVVDDTIAVPDLPWREGINFRPLHEVESQRRKRSCSKLDFFRATRPLGRQDPRELLRQENAISAFDDAPAGAEFWLGSSDALFKEKYRRDYGIDAVILVSNSGLGHHERNESDGERTDRDGDDDGDDNNLDDIEARSDGLDGGENDVDRDGVLETKRSSAEAKDATKSRGGRRQGRRGKSGAGNSRRFGQTGHDDETKSKTARKDDILADARLGWVAELEDHYIIEHGADTFEEFTSTHLPALIRFIESSEQKNRRLLVAAADAKAMDSLIVPSVILIAYFMIVKDMRLRDAREILRQRCYFYSAQAAQDKAQRLRAVVNHNELELASEEATLIAHETRPELPRVLLPEAWLKGLQTLEDHILARRVKAARRRQADFRSNFVM